MRLEKRKQQGKIQEFSDYLAYIALVVLELK
jgi:hypothetical protein